MSFHWPDRIYGQAFTVGILPIWAEVLASQVTGYEPSTETARGKLVADAIADAICFLVLPALWCLSTWSGQLVALGMIFFVGAGLYRLRRFLKEGLVGGTHFNPIISRVKK